MRNINIILVVAFFALLLNGCNFEDRIINGNCKFDSDISTRGNVLTQSQQNFYFNIWKYLLKKENNMTDTYFDNHITKYVISSYKWNAGITFQIDYIMHIDWMDIKCQDNFIVKMNSSYSAFEYLNIPRDIFFNQDQIETNLNSVVSSISTYNLIETLKYKNCKELKRAIIESSGFSEATPDYPTYYVPGKSPSQDGYPYVIINGVVNENDNECLSGYINLKTGECVVKKSPCLIN